MSQISFVVMGNSINMLSFPSSHVVFLQKIYVALIGLEVCFFAKCVRVLVKDFPRLLQSPLSSRDNRVWWHAETNMVICPFFRDSMSFERDYYSLFCHPETIESDGTQRQIWSSALFLETQCLSIETITVSFVIQRQSSLMAPRDKYGHLSFCQRLNVFRPRLLQSPLSSRDNRVRWHAETNMVICPFVGDSMFFDREYYRLLCHPETIKFDGTQRPSWLFTFIVFKTIVVSFTIQRQSSLMACRDHHGHSLLLFSRLF